MNKMNKFLPDGHRFLVKIRQIKKMFRRLIDIFWDEFYIAFNKEIKKLYLKYNVVPRRWKPRGVTVEVLPPKPKSGTRDQ